LRSFSQGRSGTVSAKEGLEKLQTKKVWENFSRGRSERAAAEKGLEKR